MVRKGFRKLRGIATTVTPPCSPTATGAVGGVVCPEAPNREYDRSSSLICFLLVKVDNWLTGLSERVCGWDVAPGAVWLLCSHRPNEVL